MGPWLTAFKVRGQGFQHSITDVDNYVRALSGLGSSPTDAGLREKILAEYDAEMVERGSKAVRQSLDEAEKCLDMGRINQMLMATAGHGRSA